MNIIEKIKSLIKEIKRTREDNEEIRLLIGTMLSRKHSSVKTFEESEFKVFSQFGDDGIIQYLIKNIKVSEDKFVEFGVEDYTESNTRFLLRYNNWKGLIIDGSLTHIEFIKNSSIYWRHDLTAVNSFITAENINQILEENGFGGKIGLLSVDIDGNDYWVWQAIHVTEADIVVAEYNSLFGADRSIVVPYKSNFVRSDAHYSYLYFGASLMALNDLAHQKGYAFVGCNQAGNNAYFVKRELLGTLSEKSVSEGFVRARFRESRDKHGRLTFLNEEDRRKEIVGLTVINTRTGLSETI